MIYMILIAVMKDENFRKINTYSKKTKKTFNITYYHNIINTNISIIINLITNSLVSLVSVTK